MEDIGWDRLSERFVDKKLRSMRGLDHQVATRRLAGLLARKGYAAGLAFSPLSPSCPALCRASTICGRAALKYVDGRDKPGHDGAEAREG